MNLIDNAKIDAPQLYCGARNRHLASHLPSYNPSNNMSGGHRVIRGDSYPYFVTCTIVSWLPIFQNNSYCEIIIDSLNFLRDKKQTAVNAYVIMPSHLHAIFWPVEGVHLSDVMRDFKRHTSREISATARERGELEYLQAFSLARNEGRRAEGSSLKVWQDGFYPEAIHSSKFAEQKLNYIHQNPVRAGLANTVLDWPHSSAQAYYSNVEGHVPIELLEL